MIYLLKRMLLLLKKYRLVCFFVIISAFVLPEVSVYFHKASRGADIFGYLHAGHDALNRGDLYQDSSPGKNNTWPPFFSFFISPLALLQDLIGLALTKEIWYFFNFFALILSIQIIFYLLTGEKPTFFRLSKLDFTSNLVFVPMLAVLPALVSNFFMLQINAFILLLVSLGFLMYHRKQSFFAGLFFGLAGAIKAYPGLFFIYFLFRKEWKTVSYIAFWGILLTLSPILFYGPEGYINLMKEWLSISFTQPYIVGYERFNNHSLYAFWERLLAHQLHVTVPASTMIKIFNLSSILMILSISLISIIRYHQENNPVVNVLEFSLICSMMIIFSPIAWGHYWLLLLPAAITIYYCLRTFPELRTKLILSLTITGLLLIEIPYLFSKSIIQTFLKSHSSYTISALLAIAVLLLLNRNIHRLQLKTADHRIDKKKCGCIPQLSVSKKIIEK